MRVRIAWGGGSEKVWHGRIAITDGTLSRPRLLGIEADEPGSMWIEQNRLVVRQRSPRAYDGVDLLLNAPLDANLLIELTDSDGSSLDSPHYFREIPLKNIVGGVFNEQIDDRGNRLLVRRTPGDKLRVVTDHRSLVFSPGELLKLNVQPHMLPLDGGTKVSIRAHLAEGRQSRELWSSNHETRAGQPTNIPLEVPLPEREGVFDLVITATRTGWPTSLRKPLNIKQVVARRVVQLAVISTQRDPQQEAEQSYLSSVKMERVAEIDPTNSSWHEKLGLDKLPRLGGTPRLWSGPLGNGRLETWRHPLGEMARLKPRDCGEEVSWEAYTVPIKNPGRPHVLEVEYPSDISQTLGISILEPNAAGAVMPIGLDSGIDSRRELSTSEKPRMLRHELVFWPRTTTPIVLMTNSREDLPAVYGKIRVLSGGSHLGRAFPPSPDSPSPGPASRPSRLFAAYMDRPLFPENFSASESLDRWSGQSLDDWITFHQGGSRLVEYLNHVGYGGLMMSVLADGSTIYPSELLQATPRYDKGILFSSGQDPIRKDVLEMLLRQFDRDRLQLIPMLDFASPLPDLESIRRSGDASIEWIGPTGTTYCQENQPRRGLAPYYNLLDPRVQEAMLDVVRELASKYSHHRSFGGVSIRLSASGYAQLPGPEWGMDDDTIARFSRDVKLNVPGSGPTRFQQRAAFLGSPKYAPAWLRWRAQQVERFYDRMHAELVAFRPEAKLYLAGAGMFDSHAREDELRPALPRRTTLSDAMLRVGFDPDSYRGKGAKGPILLRPEELIPDGRLGTQAVNLEIKQMADAEKFFGGESATGSVFFHRPKEVRVGSFDAKSPFKPTYTWLVSQAVPSGQRNRQRFVHSLARSDSRIMCDGGWLLPMGQEDSTRDLLATYRLLPDVPFQRLDNIDTKSSSQPAVFRWAMHGGATYVYVVNDAPFSVDASVRVNAPAGSRLEELTGTRQVRPLERDAEGAYWSVRLRPYDLVAVRLSSSRIELSRPNATVPAAVEKALASRIRKLGARAAALNNPSPMKVLGNPGFELSETPGQISNWTTTGESGTTIAIDEKLNSGGKLSARISSDGPAASLVSEPFDAPKTGRISMSVWLRVADASRQPPLRLALEGTLDGREYHRSALLGKAPRDGHEPVPIGTQWERYVFQVDGLPLEGLSELRVCFDLTGPGEVWVDDVQLFDLVFSKRELVELSKMITLAEIKLQNGQFGDCMHLLDGYWPRFLQENVDLPETQAAAASVARRERPQRTAAKPPTDDAGFMGRLKSMLPEQLRF